MNVLLPVRSKFSLQGGTPAHISSGANLGYFYSGREQFDLTKVRIISNSVDTIRQLYSGVPRSDLLTALHTSYESTFQPIVKFFGFDWVLSGGSTGGFKYMLRNNDLGLVVHLLSRFTKPVDIEGSDQCSLDYPVATHLKIECSPHFVFSRDTVQIQQLLDTIALQFFSSDLRPAGCAIHLAVDVAGIGSAIPAKFRDRFISRSGLRSQHSPLSEFDHSSFVVTYGPDQSILYGKADRIQFNAYNKSLQAVSSDKVDFWDNVWLSRKDSQGLPVYHVGEDVIRFEWRLHQSVLQEFVPIDSPNTSDDQPFYDSNTGEISSLSIQFSPILSYLGCHAYLDSIWQYCLKRFSLRLSPGSNVVDPLWVGLMQDVSWGSQPLVFRRNYSKNGLGSEKNVGLWLGNFLSLAARSVADRGKNFVCRLIFKSVSSSPVWKDLFFYYFKRVYFNDYQNFQREISSVFSGNLSIPTDWQKFIPREVFNKVSGYIRESVINAGVQKRMLIGKAAI